MPPRPAPPDWAAIRIRYEVTDDPAADICADAGIEKADLARIAKREHWRRQKPRPFPPLRRPTTAPPPVSRSARQSARIRDRVGEGLAPPSPTRQPRPLTPRRGEPRAAPKSRTRAKSRVVKATPTRAIAGKKPKTAAAPADPGATRVPPAPPKHPVTRSPVKTATATATTRRQLLDRMVAAISLKLEQLERRMTQHLDGDDGNDVASATDHERETRAIGTLIDNLGKVTEMETGLARTGKSDAATADLAGDADRWRRELAQRLARIVGTAKS